MVKAHINNITADNQPMACSMCKHARQFFIEEPCNMCIEYKTINGEKYRIHNNFEATEKFENNHIEEGVYNV